MCVLNYLHMKFFVYLVLTNWPQSKEGDKCNCDWYSWYCNYLFRVQNALKLLLIFSHQSGRISLFCYAPLFNFSCTAKWLAVQPSLCCCTFQEKKKKKDGLDFFLLKLKLYLNFSTITTFVHQKWFFFFNSKIVFYF